jgi:branched-chain amino acid transport system permease protein
MTPSGLLFQAIDGLAAASSLFLVAAGLSLIFGVTRIVNFAHGSLYMLGAYVAVSAADRVGFWPAMLIAPLAVGAFAALVELSLLRRIYRAPELFQLLATFALALVINDAALFLWGAEDMLGPRAPGLAGSVPLLGRSLPSYNLFLIVVGPLVLLALHLLLTRTRFGRLIRAATQDRVMLGALGVNQAVLFTLTFAIGGALAGLGGALQIAREPATLAMDLSVIGDAFVVVVVGGMGSIGGAFVAALLIAEVKALCIAIGAIELFGWSLNVSKLTLVAEFLVMAIVLIVRPYGLFGRRQTPQPSTDDAPLRPLGRYGVAAGATILAALVALPLVASGAPYTLVLGVDILIAVLFAASLQFLMGPGGMISFGHAAYFGLGAYGAALAATALGWPMPVALTAGIGVTLIGSLAFGAFAVRLSGVYLAMLTLAFAQIVWAAAFQWEALTGGSNGIVGIRASWPFDSRAALFWLTLGVAAGGVLLLRRIAFAPFGLMLRATRDHPARAEAIGVDVRRVQWIAFAIAGTLCGAAGALFAFTKGSISPETIGVTRSIDALVMVLLGGVQSMVGPLIGAPLMTLLQDSVMRQTEYWRALLGAVIIALVLLFPGGIAGGVARLAALGRRR